MATTSNQPSIANRMGLLEGLLREATDLLREYADTASTRDLQERAAAALTYEEATPQVSHLEVMERAVAAAWDVSESAREWTGDTARRMRDSLREAARLLPNL